MEEKMDRSIHTYELPEGALHQDFQVFEVKGVEINNRNYPHKTDRPHRHAYYEICVFINGSGRHEIDFHTHPIHSSSVHFISPGQVHLISREKDYHGYLIVFSKEFYALGMYQQDVHDNFPFFNNYHIYPLLNMDAKGFGELLQLVDMIRRENRSRSKINTEILRSYLQIFLLKCKQYYVEQFADKAKMHDPHFAQVQQFQTLVEKHFTEYHLVQDYAEMMAMSPAVLNKYVKKITGRTALEIIMDRLVLQAKRLLIYTDLSNKEIAFRLKYNDPSYFTRMFKGKTNMSPSAFRKEMNEKYQF